MDRLIILFQHGYFWNPRAEPEIQSQLLLRMQIRNQYVHFTRLQNSRHKTRCTDSSPTSVVCASCWNNRGEIRDSRPYPDYEMHCRQDNNWNQQCHQERHASAWAVSSLHWQRAPRRLVTVPQHLKQNKDFRGHVTHCRVCHQPPPTPSIILKLYIV